MAKRSRNSPLSWKQFLIAFGITVSVAYSVAITDVVSRSIRTSHRVEALQSEVRALEEEKRHLVYELEYVQSDFYTEKVAREDLRWSRPGEKVFVPILKEPASTSGGEALSAPAPRRTEEASPKSRLEELLQLWPWRKAP